MRRASILAFAFVIILFGAVKELAQSIAARGDSALILEEEGAVGILRLGMRSRELPSGTLQQYTVPTNSGDDFWESSATQLRNADGEVFSVGDESIEVTVGGENRVVRIDILDSSYFTQRFVRAGQSSLGEVFKEYGNPERVCGVGNKFLAFAYSDLGGGSEHQVLFASADGLTLARKGEPLERILAAGVTRVILRKMAGADSLYKEAITAFGSNSRLAAVNLLEWSLCEAAPRRGVLLYGTYRVPYSPHAQLAKILAMQGDCEGARREVKLSRREGENLEGLSISFKEIEGRCRQ